MLPWRRPACLLLLLISLMQGRHLVVHSQASCHGRNRLLKVNLFRREHSFPQQYDKYKHNNYPVDPRDHQRQRYGFGHGRFSNHGFGRYGFGNHGLQNQRYPYHRPRKYRFNDVIKPGGHHPGPSYGYYPRQQRQHDDSFISKLYDVPAMDYSNTLNWYHGGRKFYKKKRSLYVDTDPFPYNKLGIWPFVFPKSPFRRQTTARPVTTTVIMTTM